MHILFSSYSFNFGHQKLFQLTFESFGHASIVIITFFAFPDLFLLVSEYFFLHCFQMFHHFFLQKRIKGILWIEWSVTCRASHRSVGLVLPVFWVSASCWWHHLRCSSDASRWVSAPTGHIGSAWLCPGFCGEWGQPAYLCLSNWKRHILITHTWGF